jgi:hypothetical protein
MPKAIIVVREPDKAGFMQLVSSHGIDLASGREFVVSQDDPRRLGARFDADFGEWVLD